MRSNHSNVGNAATATDTVTQLCSVNVPSVGLWVRLRASGFLSWGLRCRVPVATYIERYEAVLAAQRNAPKPPKSAR